MDITRKAGDFLGQCRDAQLMVSLTLASRSDSMDDDVFLAVLADMVGGSSETALARALRLCAEIRREVPASADTWAQAQARVDTLAPPPGRSGGGRIIGAARSLLTLLLYVASCQRDEAVSAVPWSAVRVRLLPELADLHTYLSRSLSSLGQVFDAPDDPVAGAWRTLYQFVDHDADFELLGITSPFNPRPESRFGYGIPHARTMLDVPLCAELGGFGPQTQIIVVPRPTARPEPCTVVSPLWTPATPVPGREQMIDLAQDSPVGYVVRRGGHEERVRAEMCSALSPKSGTEHV